MSRKNCLSRPDVPPDPRIPQQSHRQRRTAQQSKQRDENHIRHRRHQPPNPTAMPLFLRRTSGIVNHRAESYLGRAMNSKATTRVVIIGAGFGGLNAARTLARAPLQITVIDRKNHHTFQPLLYQVATAGLSPGEIAAPIRSILRSHKNVEVLMAEVTGFDLERRLVHTHEANIPYDYLIVAAGAHHAYLR